MKLLIAYKADALHPDRMPETEVFDGVTAVRRDDGWLVMSKDDGGEWGISRDEVHLYWLATDEQFDAEAARGSEARE